MKIITKKLQQNWKKDGSNELMFYYNEMFDSTNIYIYIFISINFLWVMVIYLLKKFLDGGISMHVPPFETKCTLQLNAKYYKKVIHYKVDM